MYRTVLLDLDGTLLDTTPGVIYAVKYTIEELCLKMPSEEVLESFVGPPMQLSFEQHFGIEETKALECANLFRKNYREQSLFKAELYPHVLETLEILKQNGYKIAVATNKSHDNAVMILEHFGVARYCDYMMGSDLAGKLKKSDIIRACMINLKCSVEESVYVGDSIFDLEGAQNVGVDFIAATYGFGFNQDTKFSQDNVIGSISNFCDLTECLLRK